MAHEQRAPTLYEAFAALSYRFFKFIDGDKSDDVTALTLIDDFAKVEKLIQVIGIYSSNEELAEFSVKTISLLSVPYFIGRLHASITNLRRRRDHLLISSNHLLSYLSSCRRLGLLEQDECDSLDEGRDVGRSPVDAAEMRNRKINRYKREKEANQKMKAIQKALKDRGYDVADETVDIPGDLEDAWRELSTLRLQSFARQSLDELQSMRQEISLLAHMDDLRELQELQGDAAQQIDASAKERKGKEGEEQAVVVEKGGLDIPFSLEEIHGRTESFGEGISVTRTQKIGDQIIMSRDTVRAGVFVPRMAGPSMTLEEFGDLQLADLRQREERQRQREWERAAEAQRGGGLDRGDQGGGDVRRYAQLEAEGDEDDVRLVDRAIMADREWDAWKEANPRGSGNKLNKRF